MGMRLNWTFLAMAVALHGYQSAGAQGVQKKLEKDWYPDRAIQAPFRDVVEFISDRFDIAIAFDKKAFADAKVDLPFDAAIKFSRMGPATVDAIWRLVLEEVDCVYEIRGQKVVVLPKWMGDKARSFPPISERDKYWIKKMQINLAKKVNIEQGGDTWFLDVLDLLKEKCELAFFVKWQAFEDAELANPENFSIKLEKRDNVPCETILNELLKRVKGKFEVAPGYIRIVPAK